MGREVTGLPCQRDETSSIFLSGTGSLWLWRPIPYPISSLLQAGPGLSEGKDQPAAYAACFETAMGLGRLVGGVFGCDSR